MRRLALLAAAALVGSTAGLLAPAAADASGAAVIRDCLNNGHLTKQYSQQDYANALAHLPSDVAEYSNCASIIRHAQLAAASGGGGGGGGGASAGPSTPAERAAVASAGRSPGAIRVGGSLVRPGIVGLRTGSVFNALPTPLLIAMIAVVIGAVVFAGGVLRKRVRTRRSD